jgi:hypothetical protein
VPQRRSDFASLNPSCTARTSEACVLSGTHLDGRLAGNSCDLLYGHHVRRRITAVGVDSTHCRTSILQPGRYTRRLRPTGMVNVSSFLAPSPLANGSARQAPISSVRR